MSSTVFSSISTTTHYSVKRDLQSPCESHYCLCIQNSHHSKAIYCCFICLCLPKANLANPNRKRHTYLKSLGKVGWWAMAVLNPLREPCIYLRQTYILCCRIAHGYTATCLDFCCCLFLCLDKQFRDLCFWLVKEPKPIKAQNHLIKENLKGRERSQTLTFSLTFSDFLWLAPLRLQFPVLFHFSSMTSLTISTTPYFTACKISFF